MFFLWCVTGRYCEERPLLLGNVGMGARLCTYYQKSAPGDQTGNLMRNGNNGLGSVLILDPADKSPFLGDIKPGCSQSSLETNMYRAPIYQHKVSSADFLLVRTAKGKLSIRRIDRIDVVGQQVKKIFFIFYFSLNISEGLHFNQIYCVTLDLLLDDRHRYMLVRKLFDLLVSVYMEYLSLSHTRAHTHRVAFHVPSSTTTYLNFCLHVRITILAHGWREVWRLVSPILREEYRRKSRYSFCYESWLFVANEYLKDVKILYMALNDINLLIQKNQRIENCNFKVNANH